MPSNDNHTPVSHGPGHQDGHGRAALLLTESLIHGLRERAALSAQEAIDIAGRAVDVQADLADAADGDGAALWRSHALLVAITRSLEADMVGNAGR